MDKIAGHAPRVPSVDADVIPMDDLSHEEEAAAHALEMHNPRQSDYSSVGRKSFVKDEDKDNWCLMHVSSV